jgi:ABC-2 type transport system ATP-binding protein
VLETVEQLCDRVVVIAKGGIVADSRPSELKSLMSLPSMESVFAQLVQQQDTRETAREVLEVMRMSHA